MCYPVINASPKPADASAARPSTPEETEVLMRRLTASLAHNVNNALTGVIGYLELGRRQPGVGAEADSYLRSGLECAHQAAEAVRRIVRCAGRVSAAQTPAMWSLRRLAEEAADGTTMVVGTSAGQVFVSASLVRCALNELLDAAASAAPGAALTLRLADEDDQCTLSIEGPLVVSAELRYCLLEPSLMVEIQGGAVEILSPPGKDASIRLSFPRRSETTVRRTDASSAPAPPHSAVALGLLCQTV